MGGGVREEGEGGIVKEERKKEKGNNQGCPYIDCRNSVIVFSHCCQTESVLLKK